MEILLERPDNLQDALALATNDAIRHQISYQHNDAQGYGSGQGFAGHYAIHSDHIVVTVTKKLFFVPESTVTKEVKKYWAQICAKTKERGGV